MELERSPRPPSRNWGCLLLRGEGREGEGREGRGGEGGKRRGGREGEEREGRRGEVGKGRDDLHPTRFLGPGPVEWRGVVGIQNYRPIRP